MGSHDAVCVVERSQSVLRHVVSRLLRGDAVERCVGSQDAVYVVGMESKCLAANAATGRTS